MGSIKEEDKQRLVTRKGALGKDHNRQGEALPTYSAASALQQETRISMRLESPTEPQGGVPKRRASVKLPKHSYIKLGTGKKDSGLLDRAGITADEFTLAMIERVVKSEELKLPDGWESDPGKRDLSLVQAPVSYITKLRNWTGVAKGEHMATRFKRKAPIQPELDLFTKETIKVKDTGNIMVDAQDGKQYLLNDKVVQAVFAEVPGKLVEQSQEAGSVEDSIERVGEQLCQGFELIFSNTRAIDKAKKTHSSFAEDTKEEIKKLRGDYSDLFDIVNLLAKRGFDPAHEKLMDKYAEVLIPRSSLPKD